MTTVTAIKKLNVNFIYLLEANKLTTALALKYERWVLIMHDVLKIFSKR